MPAALNKHHPNTSRRPDRLATPVDASLAQATGPVLHWRVRTFDRRTNSNDKALVSGPTQEKCSLRRRESLAILPLQNLRQDANSDFLGFSFADALITDYVSSATVRPSAVVENYRGKPLIFKRPLRISRPIAS
jgi:hypothetical protein